MIDIDRLRRDLDAVNDIGRIADVPGIDRVSFSPRDMEGRRWLMARLEEAGLAARMDKVGNVFGRWQSGAGATLLAGSHLDTVPQGGAFDGALGVLAALEAVRTLKEQGFRPARPIEIVCTADEEGRFGGMLGSQSLTGEAGPDWMREARDDRGTPLAEAMAAQGLAPADVALPPGSIHAFLELHIEQGPVLESIGEQIGIVDAVSGVFNWLVTLTGQANHSGTTPMAMRRDAFRGLAEFGAAIGAILDEAGGPDSRLTVGQADLRPNFPHSIAGEAVFSIIGRDTDEAVMQALAAACRERLDRAAEAHGLALGIAEQSWLPPTRMDARIVEQLVELAQWDGLKARVMASGAGHDAQTFARHVPAGLIFVPSRGGISHAPDEWTDWADIEPGVILLTRAIAALAGE